MTPEQFRSITGPARIRAAEPAGLRTRAVPGNAPAARPGDGR